MNDTTNDEPIRNSDWPLTKEVSHPARFPHAYIGQCARITTRVYDPLTQETEVVPNVLVKTRRAPTSSSDDDSDSDSDSSARALSDVDSDVVDDGDDAEMMDVGDDRRTMRQPGVISGGIMEGGEEEEGEERAYWLQRTIRDAIFGKVRQGVILRRRRTTTTTTTTNQINNNNGNNHHTDAPPTREAEWEIIPGKYCAIKEMLWQTIRAKRSRLAEDPISEISTMQFLQRQVKNGRGHPETIMVENHVLVTLDVLSDDRYLYSILPYANGGELFDRLEVHEKFTEGEARYWMRQILKGLDSLQQAGICHRDMSLENLLVHDGSCIVMDFGMSLRIPYKNTPTNTTTTTPPVLPQRLLLRPQGTCGKWNYMSPEIASNAHPFDAHAVDLWSTGVILFIMLTGFPPWERPDRTDDRFRYMTAGYLVQMLTEWRLGLSAEAMDLLQNMLWYDPRDRLSLEQVKVHPWVVDERVVMPEEMGG